MFRRVVIMAATAGVVMFSATASAGLILLSDAREIYAFAAITTPNGTFTDGPRTASPSHFGAAFDETVTASVVDGDLSNALAEARQESFFSSERLYVGNSLHNHVHNTSGTTSHSLARSTVDMTVLVEAGTLLSISGISSGDGYVELRDSNDNVIFDGGGGLRRFFESDEQLRVITFSISETGFPDVPRRQGGGTITIRVVPAPGAALPLAAIGFVTRRPRRAGH